MSNSAPNTELSIDVVKGIFTHQHVEEYQYISETNVLVCS